jgi:AcrR family transcriptional regulator
MTSIRPPKQRRSQETLTLFLEATQSLLQDKHFDSISVNEIVARAGSSVGAFYARFQDKDALLACLHEAFVQDTERETRRLAESADWDALPLETGVRHFVCALVQQHRRHRGTLRALVGRTIAGGSGGLSALPLAAPDAAAQARFFEYLFTRRREMDHPNPDVAVHLGLAMVSGAVRERILFPELSSSAKPAAPVTDAVLAEELSRAFLAFLGVNPARRTR